MMPLQNSTPDEQPIWSLRVVLLGLAALLSALPLIWFSFDDNAGDTLLKWTNSSHANRAVSPSPQPVRASNPTPALLDQTVSV